jgi:antirestriction protein ArdC
MANGQTNCRKDKPMSEKQDVYTKITDKIIADPEKGVRTWMQPWGLSNAAGRITAGIRSANVDPGHRVKQSVLNMCA